MHRRSAALLALALLLPLPGLAGEVLVKPGDTLGELAERYGTTVERLMQLNGLRSPQDLWAGSRIQVPGASAPSRPASASASPPVSKPPRPGIDQLAEVSLTFSDPPLVIRAQNVERSVESAMKRVEPSQNTATAPPGWKE